MTFSPRQLLTSGTAVAAVAGALLLGAEDVGLAPFARAHAVDAAVLWGGDGPLAGPSGARARGAAHDAAGSSAPH